MKVIPSVYSYDTLRLRRAKGMSVKRVTPPGKIEVNASHFPSSITLVQSWYKLSIQHAQLTNPLDYCSNGYQCLASFTSEHLVPMPRVSILGVEEIKFPLERDVFGFSARMSRSSFPDRVYKLR